MMVMTSALNTDPSLSLSLTIKTFCRKKLKIPDASRDLFLVFLF